MRLFSVILAGICLAATTTSAVAQDSSIGLNVGKKAAPFEAKDQNGKTVTLSDLLKESNVALVFYRSASWWPFCKRQLVQLQKDLEKINKAKIQVVGVSYDSSEVLQEFAGRQKVSFSLLSDRDSEVIKAYRVLDESAGGRQKGIPIPTTFVIDREGVVRAKLPGTTRVRHTTEQLLEAAKGLN